MLALLRRSRLLASLLLLASPGGVGSVLPVLHPCPVDSPWLADQAGRHSAAHAGHHGSHAPAPAQKDQDQDQTCHCIGSCSIAAVPSAPEPLDGSRLQLPLSGPAWFARDASLRLAPLATLLPPATAPPVG